MSVIACFELYLIFITDKETNDAYKPKYECAHPLIQKQNKNKKQEQQQRDKYSSVSAYTSLQ